MRGVPLLGVALGFVVAFVVVALGALSPDEEEGTVDGPVIAVAGWDAYPTAQISGELRLVEDCLLIGESVVFWQEGASWDEADQAVMFEDADPVRVGVGFSGGGGHYSGSSLDGLDGLDIDAVQECVRRTGADDVVVATSSG